MIDLRSDTVTQPTDAMWEVMRAAPLGDDVLGDEPSVINLEEMVANLLGKEAALFTPSGTMANQLAIRCCCQAGDEIISHRENHIIHYETGAPAAISGCMIAGVDGPGGIFTGHDVRSAIRGIDIHAPLSRIVMIENTHNRGGGSVWKKEQFEHVAEAAHEHGLDVHIDGARLMNACVASEYSPKEFAAQADSVSICFSKGLGAPVGSALVGSQKMITQARRFRKMLGGGMRQSGMLAAAAQYALEHHVDRLAEDHAHAQLLAESLSEVEGITVLPVAGDTRTNMVYIRIDPTSGTAADFQDALEKQGIGVLALGPHVVRVVMHLHITDHDVHTTAEAIRTVAQDLSGQG